MVAKTKTKNIKKKTKRKEKKKHTYRPYLAINIVYSIGFIPRDLFVAESKEIKVVVW